MVLKGGSLQVLNVAAVFEFGMVRGVSGCSPWRNLCTESFGAHNFLKNSGGSSRQWTMHVCVFSENQNCAWTSSCGYEDFPKWRVSVSAWSPWECRLPLNPCSWISSVHPKWQHEMFVSLPIVFWIELSAAVSTEVVTSFNNLSSYDWLFDSFHIHPKKV